MPRAARDAVEETIRVARWLLRLTSASFCTVAVAAACLASPATGVVLALGVGVSDWLARFDRTAPFRLLATASGLATVAFAINTHGRSAALVSLGAVASSARVRAVFRPLAHPLGFLLTPLRLGIVSVITALLASHFADRSTVALLRSMDLLSYDMVEDLAQLRLSPRVVQLLGQRYELPASTPAPPVASGVDSLGDFGDAAVGGAAASVADSAARAKMAPSTACSEQDADKARVFRLRILAIFWFTYRRGFPPIEGQWEAGGGWGREGCKRKKERERESERER